MRGVRSRLPHVAGAQHDQIRLSSAQTFVIETESGHHPWPHVLDNDVRPFNQSTGQLQPFSVLKIERDATLRIVKECEAPGSVKPDFAVFERWILKPKSIRPLSRLDMHYSRAKVRQVFADTRPSGIRAEFDDLDMGQGVLDLGLSCPRGRTNKRR